MALVTSLKGERCEVTPLICFGGYVAGGAVLNLTVVAVGESLETQRGLSGILLVARARQVVLRLRLLQSGLQVDWIYVAVTMTIRTALLEVCRGHGIGYGLSTEVLSMTIYANQTCSPFKWVGLLSHRCAYDLLVTCCALL